MPDFWPKSGQDPPPRIPDFSHSRFRSMRCTHQLRHDALLAEAAQEPHEHLLAVDHIMKAVESRFGYVGHDIPMRAEHVIGERPGDSCLH